MHELHHHQPKRHAANNPKKVMQMTANYHQQSYRTTDKAHLTVDSLFVMLIQSSLQHYVLL